MVCCPLIGRAWHYSQQTLTAQNTSVPVLHTGWIWGMFPCPPPGADVSVLSRGRRGTAHSEVLLWWLHQGRAARSTGGMAQSGGSKMVTWRGQFSLIDTVVFFLPAHTLRNSQGFLIPTLAWGQDRNEKTHVFITKRHLYTTFLILNACVKGLFLGLSLNLLFTQLSRIMAFKWGRKEWVIICYTSPDPTISLANECDAFQGSHTDAFVSHQLFTYLVNNLNVLECAYYKITAFVL